MDDVTRFWRYVDRRGDDECWPWQAGKKEPGYGNVRWNGRLSLAHRVAYEIASGHAPGALNVLHRCDNPCCVNPAHLFLGTQRDNMADARTKGRTARGERHGKAVLTAEQVRAIRERFAAGGVTQSQLGREYGITQSHVWHIINYRMWKHLKERS
jgi:hypothetical protein